MPKSNLSEKVSELLEFRASVARLEQEIGSELGLITVNTVPPVRGYQVTIKTPAKPKKKRKRAKITDDMRATAKNMFTAKKMNVGEVAAALGISKPAAQNIKKALGLVKKQ